MIEIRKYIIEKYVLTFVLETSCRVMKITSVVNNKLSKYKYSYKLLKFVNRFKKKEKKKDSKYREIIEMIVKLLNYHKPIEILLKSLKSMNLKYESIKHA